MKGLKSMVGWLVCLLSAVLMMAPPSPAAEASAVTVGRIFHIEGDLLRYVPEEKDWVAVVRDAPFGAEDTLLSGMNGMAELIVPNGIWIRTGNGTQIQFIRLDADLAEMDVASGRARFYSKGQAAVKVTSPFGYVLAAPATIFDLYVGENSVEIISIKGAVSFIHQATDRRYEVAAGATSILADQQQVSLGDGTVDADWNRWNMDRENFWLAKGLVRGPSADYLPPELRDESYTFEENGKWERIPYEGQDRWFWQPTVVAEDWSPFTVGRWTDWYGDQTWIPAEPFGYVTHHYGNWVYVRSRWYWAPPVVSVRIGLPLPDIGFFWYPGRVSWIHSGVNVGWVPLAPRETYYCRRPWGGPHTVVVNQSNINRVSINIRHAYVDHAVIVNRSHLHDRDDYRTVRVANINRTAIISHYRSAPVVSNAVIKNYETNRQRYNYTNVRVNEKPRKDVINRIQQNRRLIFEGRKENASVIQERVKGIPEGRIRREIRIDQPRITNPVAPASEVNRPRTNIPPERFAPPVPTVQRQERAVPAKPAQVDRPMPHGRPTQRPERAAPAKPAQPQQPVQVGQPTQKPESAAQKRPAQTDRPLPPAQRQERVVPAKPAQVDRPLPPGRPTQRPERAAPVKPAQPQQPVQSVLPAEKQERVIPIKQGQPKNSVEPGEPAEQQERRMPTRPGVRR